MTRSMIAIALDEKRLSALHGKRRPPRDTERAMSEENVETMRRSVAAVEGSDKDAFGELCHPEIEVVPLATGLRPRSGGGTLPGISCLPPVNPGSLVTMS
jgi:hypothetical protein